ncbi:uncharacterized protein LOC144726678 isoform X2 [Lampetra planeri]
MSERYECISSSTVPGHTFTDGKDAAENVRSELRPSLGCLVSPTSRTWQRRFENGTVVSGVTLVNVQPPCQQFIGIILWRNGEMCLVATLRVNGTVEINNDGKGEVYPEEQSVRQGDSATFKCRIPADKCQTLNLTWKILPMGQVMWHQSTELQRGEGFIFSTVTFKNVHSPTLATSFIRVNCYLHRAQNTSTFVDAALLKFVDLSAKEHHWKQAVITLSCCLVLGVFIYIILIKYRFVWPDIPDPKNCSWAKGIDFSKPGNSNDWWKFHKLPATKPESFVPTTEAYYTSVHNIEIHVDGDVSCITQYRDVADNTTHAALPQSVIYTLVVPSNGSLLSEDEPKLLGNELCKTGSEVNDAPACSNFIIPSYLKQNLDKIIT